MRGVAGFKSYGVAAAVDIGMLAAAIVELGINNRSRQAV